MRRRVVRSVFDANAFVQLQRAGNFSEDSASSCRCWPAQRGERHSGVFMETHPDPGQGALGRSQRLAPDRMKELLATLKSRRLCEARALRGAETENAEKGA